ASKSAFVEEPMQTTCQMEEPPHLVFETGSDDQTIIQTSQHPEWFSQPRRPPLPDRDWTKTLPTAQGDAQSWINNRGRRVIPFEHFINNNLENLRGGASSRKYTTSVTKTKAADYGHIRWIEDLVPRAMWIQQPIDYNRHALWGVSHWGRKRKQFYGYAVNWESARDVYSKRRIIAVTELQIMEWYDYKHLDWISEHCHQEASGRPSTGSGKLPEEAQPYEARHVKEQVSRILPRIEESMNATLEAEVLTRSSHSSRTSYAIAADLSEMELKKILIEKMEGNKSIQRSDEQGNLYKALVKAYDADKAILDTYEESTILKRRREDDDQEGPSAGSDRGSKRQKEGGEHAPASIPSETATGSAGRSTTGRPPLPDRDWNKTLPAAQGDAQSWISDLARKTDARSSFNELLDTPIDFSNFIMNRLNVNTLTPALLAGPTYELMRWSCTSLTELEYHLEEVYKATTDQLDWVNLEGAANDQPVAEASQHPEWFQKQKKPLTLDRAWNKTLLATHRSI
nr:hypothetical protein [Tanacetum cinerariifolium]